MLYVSYSSLFLMARGTTRLVVLWKKYSKFCCWGGCAIDWLIFKRLPCGLGVSWLVEKYNRYFFASREKFFLTSGLLLLAPFRDLI
ncbi:hypothetical protein J7L27_06220 [Candidatus Bathyarchaeota archaeon]|nr:hypothetical protein [Candidatus Bathyarchaeota archaeon]